jgi:formylglycine-generating enzyme required for sulfatase activity
MEFVKIPAGSFMMGCSPGDAECYVEEKPSSGHYPGLRNGKISGNTVTV